MCLQIYDIILKPPNFLHRNVYNMGQHGTASVYNIGT